MTFRANLQMGPSIGSGHFGQVFSATDEAHGIVAVKVQGKLPFETEADWQARKTKHIAEGQHLSQARHTNVVHIHGLLESEKKDAVLIVMDHCSGGCLQSQYEVGPLPLSKCASTLRR